MGIPPIDPAELEDLLQAAEDEAPAVEGALESAGEAIASEAEKAAEGTEELAQEAKAEGKAALDKLKQSFSNDEVGDATTQCEASSQTPDIQDLEATQVNAKDGVTLEVDRIAPGTNDKVAVVGRSMQDVRPFTKALADKGYKVEIFDGDQISDGARDEWEALTSGGRHLSDEEVTQTQLYEENQAWAQKLKSKGYTIVDIDNPRGSGPSPFYAMEQSTIFGASTQ